MHVIIMSSLLRLLIPMDIPPTPTKTAKERPRGTDPSIGILKTTFRMRNANPD